MRRDRLMRVVVITRNGEAITIEKVRSITRDTVYGTITFEGEKFSSVFQTDAISGYNALEIREDIDG